MTGGAAEEAAEKKEDEPEEESDEVRISYHLPHPGSSCCLPAAYMKLRSATQSRLCS